MGEVLTPDQNASWAGRLWANGPVLLAFCMLCWAGSVVTGRAAAAQVPPALFTAVRWYGALAIVLPFAAGHLRRDWPALRARWWVVGVLALLGVVTYNSLVYRGLHETTAVNALLMQSVQPLLVIVADLVLFRDRPRTGQVAGILVSVLGVTVIAAQGSLDVLRGLRINPGDGYVFVAVACYALYGSMLRLRPAVHAMSLLAASVALGDVVLGPMAWAEYAGGARLVVTPLSVGCLAYAAVFPGFLAYLCFNRGVALVGAVRAGQFSHLMPAFGIVLAVLFLGEQVHWYHWAGVGLVGVGLVLAAGLRVRRPSPHA